MRERLPCGCIVLLDADGLACCVLHPCTDYPPSDGEMDEIPDWQTAQAGDRRRKDRWRQRRKECGANEGCG